MIFHCIFIYNKLVDNPGFPKYLFIAKFYKTEKGTDSGVSLLISTALKTMNLALTSVIVDILFFNPSHLTCHW